MFSSVLFVRGHTGLRLRLKAWGEGSNACFLIHGFGDGSFVWEHIAPTIAKTHRTFAVDLRGHGESDWAPDGRYEVDAHVKDLLVAIEQLKLKNVTLVGHSMGADIAISMAARLPEIIKGLVVVDFSPEPAVDVVERINSDFRASHRRYTSVSEYRSRLADNRPLVSPQLLHRIAEMALREDGNGMLCLRSDAAMAAESDKGRQGKMWESLSQIVVPALVVRGIASAVLGKDVALRMVRTIKDARLDSIYGAGHSVMLDNPSAFLQSLSRFLIERSGPIRA